MVHGNALGCRQRRKLSAPVLYIVRDAVRYRIEKLQKKYLAAAVVSFCVSVRVKKFKLAKNMEEIVAQST